MAEQAEQERSATEASRKKGGGGVGEVVTTGTGGGLSDKYSHCLIMSIGGAPLTILGPMLLQLIGNGGENPHVAALPRSLPLLLGQSHGTRKKTLL